MRDERETCEGCGGRYFPAQKWAHRGCVANTLANGVPGIANAAAQAANKLAGPGKIVAEEPRVVHALEEAWAAIDARVRRRSYMRDLMRGDRRRKEMEGKA